MGLFGKKKAAQASAEELAREENAKVKILGGGCARCNDLEAATVAALHEMGADAPVGHVRDFVKIAAYGVMTTPALVVDNKVLASGRVLTKDEVKALLQKELG